MSTRLTAPSLASVLFGLAALGGGTESANAVTILPTCTEPVNCLVFGDFNVYSLPLLNLQAGLGDVPGPGSPYYYPSGFGQIKDYTIIGINNGQSTDTGNPDGSDGSYNTPSQNNTTNVAFSTVTSENPGGTPDPGGSGEFVGDSDNSWDIQTDTLLTLIDGTPLVAFFAFNETGSGTGLLTTDLLIWAQVTLSSNDGSAMESFYLSGDDSSTVPTTDNLPAPDATDFGPWVYVHAGICVRPDGTFTGFPQTDGSCADPESSVANQNNLGQNAASFMINSPDLDAALNTGLYDYMQVTWKMAYINGGGETAWIQSVGATQVPEPGILSLLGLGLLATAITPAIARKNTRAML